MGKEERTIVVMITIIIFIIITILYEARKIPCHPIFAHISLDKLDVSFPN